MAELLIIVLVVVTLLGYAADRARKLRVRARQLSGMNDRLDAAAAKVDRQQQQKRAVVRASAELTSVLPAIKRPPLTIPGMAGHGGDPEPDEDAAPAAAGPADESPSADGAGTAGDGTGPAAEAGPAEAGGPAAAEGPAEAGGPAAPDGPAGEPSPDEAEAPAVPAAPWPASRLAENTLSMPAGATAGDPPVPGLTVTPDGTLIMRAVPGQGPAPAGEALLGQDGTRDERHR